MSDVPGMTAAIMVRLGENDVKTVEDFAGCVPDDLVGWTERKDGESVKHAGYLTGLDISREDAEQMIMAARVKAGWVEAPAEPADSEAGGQPAAG